jgi:hypothetical protein
MNNQKISYKVLTTKNKSWLSVNISSYEIENKLNELGRDGWDLVNTFDVNHEGGSTKEVLFILKKYEK